MTIPKKYAAWLGYVVYTLAVTIGFLYYRFPSDTAKAYLVSQAASARPPMVLSVKGLRPEWPPGILLTGVTIAPGETPREAVFQADSVSIAPTLWSVASGAPLYRIEAHAYQGDMRGHFRIENRTIGTGVSTSFEFIDLQIGDYSYLRSRLGRDVSGILNGEIVYEGLQNRLMEGTGQGTITVGNGKVTLSQPILGLSAFDFDRLFVTFSLKDRHITLTQVQLDGKTVKGELSGTIAMNSDPPRSRLDLKGTMEPLGGIIGDMKGDAAMLSFLRQGLKKLGRSFVIQGTLEKPTFRFL